MFVDGNNVIFGFSDAEFVKKFGIFEAAQMVLDYKALNSLPFIFDTYQLADFLGIRRKALFSLTKETNKYYNTFEITKKNGKVRRLFVPTGRLKTCQYAINRRILKHLPVSNYAAAYCKDSRISKNAAPHIGKRYLLSLI